jgi:hypothetical protein
MDLIRSIIKEKRRLARNDEDASQEEILTSEFPITVFKVLNDQISLLRESLKGESFMQYIRDSVCETFRSIMERESNELCKTISLSTDLQTEYHMCLVYLYFY